MKVFVARLKAKCKESNPQFTIKEIRELLLEYERENSRAVTAERKFKRGY